MLGHFRAPFVTLLVSAFLAGCASGPSVEPTPEKAAPVARMYTTAYVASITSTIVDDAAPDQSRLDEKKNLDAKFPALVKDGLEDGGFSVASAMPANNAGLVLVKLDFQYNPGNRALRWLGGPFGAGKGFVNGKIEAIDASTGLVIASLSESDSTRMGAFGGNFYGSVEDMAEELAEDLAEELSKKAK